MSTNQVVKETIQACMVKLKDRTTNSSDLALRLYSRRVLDDSTFERIRMPTVTESQKLDEMLFILLRKDLKEFEILKEELLNTGNDYSYNILQEEFEVRSALLTSINDVAEVKITQPAVGAGQRPSASNSGAQPRPIASSLQSTSSFQLSKKPFEILGDAIQRNLVTFEVESPTAAISAESILASLKNAKLLKNMSFTGVTFTGEFAISIQFPKLESVTFTNCKLQPKTMTWKQMIFFTKKPPQASNTAGIENVWNMGVHISINCGGIFLLQSDKQAGLLTVNAKTGLDLKSILEDTSNASVKTTHIKTLEAVGFRPTEIVLSHCPNIRDLRLLEVEIAVFKDMGTLRDILQTTGNLGSLRCSVGTNKYSAEKTVVIFLSKIKSARTLETLKMGNLDVKHSEGKIDANLIVFPLVGSCEFNKCVINGPLRERFWTDFPRVNRNTSLKVHVKCTDEIGNPINLI